MTLQHVIRVLFLSNELGNTQFEAPIYILPNLRFGGHNNPNPYPLRLPRLSGESNALRRGITGKSP